MHGRFLLRATLVVMALTATGLLAAGPASAKPANDCGGAVVDDWYGDGAVDRIYPQHCYREAIRSLPVDVRDYSNAEEDILRALAYAKAGRNDPGPTGGSRTNQPRSPQAEPSTSGSHAPALPPKPPTVAAGEVPAAAAGGIPLPLILLGGLAVVLLVAGGAGAFGRRFRTRPENDSAP